MHLKAALVFDFVIGMCQLGLDDKIGKLPAYIKQIESLGFTIWFILVNTGQ